MTQAEDVTIALDDGPVGALLLAPVSATAGYVLAHGAGAGMTHGFMEQAAHGLAARGIASLRFNFPYMECGSRRPDAPAVAQRCVRAAVATAAERLDGLPLFAGGKSFGGRMTSQAQAAEPLPQVRGLVFIGFPLHPAGKPSTRRADHLQAVRVPMLFVQGTRDLLADFALLTPTIDALGPAASLLPIADADHGFHVLRRSGRSDDAVMAQVLDGIAAWMRSAGAGGR